MKRPWLLPLTPLWRLGTALKNYAYDRRHLPIRRLQKHVISIGSLSAGGAGKTPVVVALAQLLARHNLASDVLSRGYGRGSGAIEQVDPAGSPIRYGDEPLEIAQTPIVIKAVILSEAHSAQSKDLHDPPPRQATQALSATNIPVFVGANRHAAGLLAESTLSHTAVHILDDGFQHRRLARSLDLVLLTLEDLRDRLLPAGNLREPLTSLASAHAVLLREEEAATLAPVAARHAPHAQQWLIRRTLHLPTPPPRRALAFCGLARPTNFFTQIQQNGCTLAAQLPFPDHYAYTSEDITALIHAARRVHADAFLTTAKDAVKLPLALRNRLEAVAPLHVVHLDVHFLDESAVLASIAPLVGRP